MRPYEWRPFLLAQSSVPVSTTVEFLLIPSADLNEMNSPTVMRVRMQMMFQFPANVVAGIAQGVIGMQIRDVSDVTPEDPFATGDSSDWFVWQPYLLSAEPNSSAIGGEGLYLDFDNRSMRKIGPRGHDLVMSIVNAGAEPVSVSAIGRILFKS